jgi:hypothetical protein
MTLTLLFRILVFTLGAALVARTVFSAVQTFVLPRSARDRISRIVFVAMRRLFDFWTARVSSYEERDRIMAFYAPVSLLVLPPVWLILVWLGYAAMYWGIGVDSWRTALLDSGSSLLTLGFAPLDSLAQAVLGFSEAAIGLILVALLIAYLPTMYSAFARRETAVAMLEVRAGSPSSAIELIERSYRIGRLHRLSELWVQWELWFAEIEESHTSLAALVFFRSPLADRSWVTAAGVIMDAAALAASTLDLPRDTQADLCIRAGYVALRRIADFFRIPYNARPQPTDPISVRREEFDAACDRLASQGIPLKADRDQAWRDFAGWRVNYDTVLLALAHLTMAAPHALWSTDRLPQRERQSRRRAHRKGTHGVERPEPEIPG